nr:nuclear elongation and deformation protein 1 [Quercus suber]
MQYVRSITGTVSSTWNSINPATLSGAIDVVVVEQEDGSLACSPFHIRFGKFSLLRPYEKKVEFRINGDKQDFPMKLGEGGEAFFVFETKDEVPEALQTSPLVSPVTSPQMRPSAPNTPALQEPNPFELEAPAPGLSAGAKRREHSKSTSGILSTQTNAIKAYSDAGRLSPMMYPPQPEGVQPSPAEELMDAQKELPRLDRSTTESALPAVKTALTNSIDGSDSFSALPPPQRKVADRPPSPQSASNEEAKARAVNLSKKLWTSNISNQVTESGDLMLDMTGFKSSDGEALHAEVIARQLLSEEIDGPYDIGALIGADAKGNIWIYSSEEARDAAAKKVIDATRNFDPAAYASSDMVSDPGYHSDDARSDSNVDYTGSHFRRDSDSAVGLNSQPSSPIQPAAAGDPNKNYAKTLRLTSDQLKTMNLQAGANQMAFTVNRATCNATLWYWRHDVPIVISDIDGTITKSDVMGHVMNSIGRDWTHQGVAKLYTEIAANGYNFLYLTSRSVGLADNSRAYLNSVVQEGYRLPKGPVILSPDRTIAALRREIYLRKPELFKMACLRDIMSLFAGHGGSNNTHESVEAGLRAHIDKTQDGFAAGRGKGGSPFYAGFGNRLTDALSYRSVNIPSTRIFTINSNSEVSLDLLSLNTYKTAYGSMREIVDHYFPPVGLLVKGGGEQFTDFNYWRDQPFDIVDFTDSESEDDVVSSAVKRTGTSVSAARESVLSEDDAGDDMTESYIDDARLSLSLQPSIDGSFRSGIEEELTSSVLEEDDGDADDDGGDSSIADDDDELDEDEEDEDEEQLELRGDAQSIEAQERRLRSTPRQQPVEGGSFRGSKMLS